MIPTESWINAEKNPPDVLRGKFRVMRENGVEMDAFYYMDSMVWIAYYGLKTSRWWDANGKHERLDDVISWMPLPKSPQHD